ncbi:MAG: hypothetical protein AB8B73_10900 [Ekhidna sp.]
MPSETLYREIQNLERKIQLVLNENKRLKDEVSQSKFENQRLNEQIASQSANLNTVQNQMKVNKIVNSTGVSAGDSAQLKEVIDGYVKEIDKCIAHLAE